MKIGREDNADADSLAKWASSESPLPHYPLLVVVRDRPSITLMPAIFNIETRKTWMTDIFLYIRDGILPEGKRDQLKLQRKAAKFCINDGRRYKRGFTTPLLRGLSSEEAATVLAECHRGICGNHPGTHLLTQVILSAGYYWPTLTEDSKKLVEGCFQCQQFRPSYQQPGKELLPITSPYLFAQWGIDLVGPIHPPSSNQKRFIVVCVDYFTKWAEAEALSDITT